MQYDCSHTSEIPIINLFTKAFISCFWWGKKPRRNYALCHFSSCCKHLFLRRPSWTWHYWKLRSSCHFIMLLCADCSFKGKIASAYCTKKHVHKKGQTNTNKIILSFACLFFHGRDILEKKKKEKRKWYCSSKISGIHLIYLWSRYRAMVLLLALSRDVSYPITKTEPIQIKWPAKSHG